MIPFRSAGRTMASMRTEWKRVPEPECCMSLDKSANRQKAIYRPTFVDSADKRS